MNIAQLVSSEAVTYLHERNTRVHVRSGTPESRVFNKTRRPNSFEKLVNGAGRLERNCLSSVTGERRRRKGYATAGKSPRLLSLSLSHGNIIVF